MIEGDVRTNDNDMGAAGPTGVGEGAESDGEVGAAGPDVSQASGEDSPEPDPVSGRGAN